jgi:hypothetical protein
MHGLWGRSEGRLARGSRVPSDGLRGDAAEIFAYELT